MKKLFTLLTLLVAIVTGAQAADFTAPATKAYGGLTFLDVSGTDKNTSVGTNDYLCYGALYVANTLKVTTWYNSSDGSPASNKDNGIVSDFSDQGFIQVTVTTQDNTNGNGGLKVHSGRIRYYYVTGATSVAALVKDNNSSKYTQVLIQEVASNGTLGEATIIDGNKSTSQYVLDGGELDPSKYYKISVSSNNTSNCVLYQIRFGKYVAPAGPSITDQTIADANYMQGQTTGVAALSVTAQASDANNSLEYQWYSNTTNSTEGGTAIATGTSYTPNVSAKGVTYYYCVVTEKDGDSQVVGDPVASNIAKITVSAAEAPTITVSGAPVGDIVTGTEVTLTATLTGVPSPTIQWYANTTASNTGGTAIAGATEETYAPSTATAGTYYYYAVATNTKGDATSEVQTLVVKDKVATPTITPNGAYFEDEQEVTLACTTDGATIQYSTDNGATWTNYTAALTFTATTTLQAKATKTGCIDSETASANFTLFEKAELASVSAETTWDFTGWNQELELSGTTTPTNTDEYTYSDIDLINSSITLPSGFNGDAMMFKGQYPVRSKKAQAGTWTIKTTKPGTLAVTFSDTGSKGDNPPKRYLNINGTNTEYYTQRTGSSSNQKTVTVDISAGENVITGMGEDGTTWQAICLYKIVYTPIDVDIVLDESGNNATTIAANDGQTNQKVFVNRNLSTSYYNTIFLPFAMDATQIEAAFGEGAQVATFTGMLNNSSTTFGFGNVTAMEANVPYLVKPAQEVNGFTVEGVTISNTTADATVDGGYAMVGNYDTFTNGGSTGGGSIGISIGGSSSSSANEIYYFTKSNTIKKLKSTGSIKGLRAFMVKLPAGKTSVKTIVSNAGIQFGGAGGGSARARQDFVLNLDDDNTTTGIEAIENSQLTIDNDAPAYNLAGQKVGKGYKGIVIINGKKVVK